MLTAQVEDALRRLQVDGWHEDGLAASLACPLHHFCPVLRELFTVKVRMSINKTNHICAKLNILGATVGTTSLLANRSATTAADIAHAAVAEIAVKGEDGIDGKEQIADIVER